MKTMTLSFIFIALLSQVSAETDECKEAFNNEFYEQVLKTCMINESSSIEDRFVRLAADLFAVVSPDRLDEIFYQGKYEIDVFNVDQFNDLYSINEKLKLQQHKNTFIDLAEDQHAEANLLAAKLYYLNELIIDKIDDKWPKVPWNDFQAKKQAHYNDRLAIYLKTYPDHLEALFLLGVESLEPPKIPVMMRPTRKPIFAVKEEATYAHLLKALKLGHNRAQYFVDAVNRWHDIRANWIKKAAQEDPESQFLLGYEAYKYAQFTDSAKYFEQAAKANHTEALSHLERLYQNELKDVQKYLNVIVQLAELGDTDAMLVLGDYLLCSGNAKDAEEVYSMAQEMNNPLAAYSLFDLRDYGVPQSGCMKFMSEPEVEPE
ncbi:tetratricopeptide repeat protein [Marinicella litoralis]|uniref:Tetratricopeptide repeat protein n=1 Tax=Marinicella litoralis TaxID=644220 RepID=A0A4R6XTD2_9GAMM|nr:sel1 repeat family protein [Marinicella litoralis]TDR20693.1 hypothetical protein C8D91_1671 [Marinicella litoralis]